jgi:PPK2 family polyphosphate:nucleotide phosphotransferase
MNPEDYMVQPNSQIRLSAHDPNASAPLADEQEAQTRTRELGKQLRRYQDMIDAHATYGILILFQGMDAAGKDESIEEVFSHLDPQSYVTKQFKKPDKTEAQHDFLWRVVQSLPGRGKIGIFNRSYYEQVTAEKVYPDQIEQWGLPPEARQDLWNKRYGQINNFERHLVENGFIVIKFFLHISKETERERLLERIEHPEMQHQFSEADLRHYQDWDKFDQAFDAMLSNTSTDWAPWYIIPANNRWFTYATVAGILEQKFKQLHKEYPQLSDEMREVMEKARATFKQERD